VLKDPKFEAQILYTHVDLKDSTFTSFPLRLSDQYFYPASMVKMPIAFLTLHNVNALKSQGHNVSIDDDILQYAFRTEQSDALIDTTTVSGKPNIRRYVEKIFNVSDNNAFNRLYELLGPDYINRTLHDELNIFTTSAICHRVGVTGYTPTDNKYTTRLEMYNSGQMTMQRTPMEASKVWSHRVPGALKGRGYINSLDSLVNKPFDFTEKNYYSVRDMETTLQRVLFADKFDPKQRFNLTKDDYTFLKNCLSKTPDTYSYYDQYKEFYPTYVKFLYYGSEEMATINPDLTIYNKVGNAYGYLIDCAYFENKKLGIGFFLTAVIHVNKDGIYNDGKYEYDEVGYPYLKRLGQIIYDHEVKMARKKK
jgi:Beta-lactamase enzyme family